MEKPLVSIALATYNGERFLREQIDSLLAQTYSNFELVITDDGSTDRTCEILREYAERDIRIKYARSELSRGFINNFTGAILKCRGEIIFLCDQDDIWYPNKLEMHVKTYQNNPSVMWMYNKVNLITEEGKSLGTMTDTFPDYYSKKRRWILNYVWGSCILGCTTSYRAKAIKQFLPPDENASAHDSWIQMALWPSPPLEIDEVLQDYRIHGANTSDFRLSRTEEEESALRTRAIKDNMVRLRSYSKNPRLPVWKRLTFLFALWGKLIRLVYRQLRSIISP